MTGILAVCGKRQAGWWLAVAFLTIAPGCARKAAPVAAETPRKVIIGRPSRVERPVVVAASGTVEPKEASQVAFQVPGQVARVYVEEGSPVRAGQLLAELDPRDFEFRVRQAAAQVAAARAGVRKADSAVRKQELAQAKIDLDRLEDEYRRYRQLYERKSLAPNDFKKIEAACQAARERYSLALEGARSEDRESAREALRAAEAQEQIARKALADSKLTAPVSGLIGHKEIEAGNTAGAGRPVFVIMTLNPVRVRVSVPEAEVGKLRVGRPATVQIPSLGEKTFSGKIETIGVAADPVSRTFAVKLLVANPSLELRAGMIAEARMEAGGLVRATTVPGQAIVRDPQGATAVYVYHPDKQRVYARRVDLGTVFEREVEVLRGLSGDERIVLGGQDGLFEGALVVPAEARP